MKGISRNRRVKRNRHNKTSKRYVKYGGYAVPQEVKITPKGTKITPKGTKITPKGTRYIKKNKTM